MNMTKAARHISLLLLLIVLLLAANLLVGSVAIPAGEVLRILMGEDAGRESWHYIVWEARLPQALTALLAGSALAVCGLLLQTAFRNPLAGASVLGVNSGAGLGVAVDNAPAEVKAAADRVCPSNEQQGVKQTLERLFSV